MAEKLTDEQLAMMLQESEQAEENLAPPPSRPASTSAKSKKRKLPGSDIKRDQAIEKEAMEERHAKAVQRLTSELEQLKQKQAAELGRLEKRQNSQRMEAIAALKHHMHSDGKLMCKTCGDAVAETDGHYICHMCVSVHCNKHRDGMTECVECRQPYCVSCVLSMRRCSTCAQCTQMTCCKLEKMPCGVYESGDCVFYHSKNCHRCHLGQQNGLCHQNGLCQNNNADNIEPYDQIFPNNLMADPVYGAADDDDQEDEDDEPYGGGGMYPDIFN